MKGFLDYLPGSSVLHKMHPLVKIFVSILICAASFCSSNPFYLIGVIVFNVLMAAAGNGKIKNGNGLLKRTLGILKGLIKMSIFLFILQVLVIRQGDPILTLGSFSITGLAIQKGLLLVLRLIGATLPLSILISVPFLFPFRESNINKFRQNTCIFTQNVILCLCNLSTCFRKESYEISRLRKLKNKKTALCKKK